MIQRNQTVQTAYESLKQHDPMLADRLCGRIKFAAKVLQRAIDRKREIETKYDASIWQRLTRDALDVLRPFNYAIEDEQTHYYACENDMMVAAADLSNKLSLRKESEIDAGNFVYYIVDLDTNVRKSEKGAPVIYSTIESGEWACSGKFDTVMSIAEYNRRYGTFMGKTNEGTY